MSPRWTLKETAAGEDEDEEEEPHPTQLWRDKLPEAFQPGMLATLPTSCRNFFSCVRCPLRATDP